jgi:putative peptidoglycan lipid II flippase
MGGGPEKILGQTGSVAAMTAVSRVLGYFRDRAVASLLGTSYWADAFYIALRIPSTFRRFVAEGAMTASLVPVLSASFREDPPADAWRFARRFLYAFSAGVALFGALGSLSAPVLVRLLAWQFEGRAPEVFALTEHLTALLFPYVALVAVSAAAAGILNCREVFAPPALTPALLNLSIILAAAVFGGDSSRPAEVLAWGVLAGGAVQVLFQVPFLLKTGMSFKPAFSLKDPRLRRVFALMVPGMLGAGAGQITVLVGTALAHTAGEGAVSALYYANRITELAFGLFAVSLSVVVLPRMSREAAEGDHAGLSSTLDYALGAVLFVLVPAAAGLLALPGPIVTVLFETGRFSESSVGLTTGPLVAYALGLPLWGAVSILVRASHAQQDMGTPLRAGVLSLAAFTAAALALLPSMGAAGIAAASSGSAMLQTAALVWGLRRNRRVTFRWAAMGWRLARLSALSVAMALAVSCVYRFVPEGGAAVRATSLFAAIACGILVYGAGVRLLRFPEVGYLSDLVGRVRRG